MCSLEEMHSLTSSELIQWVMDRHQWETLQTGCFTGNSAKFPVSHLL